MLKLMGKKTLTFLRSNFVELNLWTLKINNFSLCCEWQTLFRNLRTFSWIFLNVTYFTINVVNIITKCTNTKVTRWAQYHLVWYPLYPSQRHSSESFTSSFKHYIPQLSICIICFETKILNLGIIMTSYLWLSYYNCVNTYSNINSLAFLLFATTCKYKMVRIE